MTIHVFATILALYPIKPTAEIAEEFGMTEYRINKMAKACRVKKSHEFRSEVNSKNGSVNAEKLKKRTIRRAKRVEKLFDMRPYAITQRFGLKNPIFCPTAAYGHMGRDPFEDYVTVFDAAGRKRQKKVQFFGWEKLDMVDAIKKEFNLK